MLKFFIILFAIAPSLLLSQDSLKDEINEFVDEWHSNAEEADMESYFEKIAGDGIFIGTDATENWTRQEFYEWSKPYFDNGKAWAFKAISRNVYFSGDKTIAWFDEQLESSGGILRGSGVLSLQNGEWKIKHYVLSLPVPNEKFNEILNMISGK